MDSRGTWGASKVKHMTDDIAFWETFADEMYGGSRIPRIPDIIGALWEACGLKVGSAVADVCCGRGYSAIELALRGADVQAVDLSGEFIVNLSQAANALNLGIIARQGNAEKVRVEGSVCATMILWNSLGHQSPETDVRILSNARQSTHPSGSLVVELTTLEELSREPYKVTTRSVGESHTFRRIRSLNTQTGILSADWEILDKGETPVRSGHFSQRVYPKAEIVHMMNAAGWSYVIDSDKVPLTCEPTGTLFIGMAESNISDSERCTKCRGILP